MAFSEQFDKIIDMITDEIDAEAFNALEPYITQFDKYVSILDSNDIALKKSFFIENQEQIVKTVQEFEYKSKLLLELFEADCSIDSDIVKDFIQKVSETIYEKIGHFKEELLKDVDKEPEQVLVSEERLKDNINKPRMQELMNGMKEYAEEFNKPRQESTNGPVTVTKRRLKANTPVERKTAIAKNYFVCDANFTTGKVLLDATKKEVNEYILSKQLMNAKVYELKEVPMMNQMM